MNNQQMNEMSRRSFIGSAGLLAAGLCLFPRDIFAQAQSPVTKIINASKTAKISTIRLRGNVCMLDGSGGNVAVLHGKQGKLLVDAGIDVSKPNVLAALNGISADPIKFLINTHWHFDHTYGNEWLHSAGATIIAQDVTKKHLMETTRVDDWNYTFKPLAKGAIPSVVYKQEYTRHFNGEEIFVKVYAPAHTDGDSSVFFPHADILHVGDTFWNGYFPFIDYSTGGSIDGMIEATRQNINRTTAKTIVIPGHGPVGSREELKEFYHMLTTIRSRVSRLKKEGRTMNEVIAAKPTADFDARFGGFVIDGSFFTKLVYKGV